eukprot:scaffold42728_cov27-Tisochrysis_lutea.AAC.3
MRTQTQTHERRKLSGRPDSCTLESAARLPCRLGPLNLSVRDQARGPRRAWRAGRAGGECVSCTGEGTGKQRELAGGGRRGRGSAKNWQGDAPEKKRTGTGTGYMKHGRKPFSYSLAARQVAGR